MVYVFAFLFVAVIVDLFTSPLVGAIAYDQNFDRGYASRCVFIYNLLLYGAAIFFGLTW